MQNKKQVIYYDVNGKIDKVGMWWGCKLKIKFKATSKPIKEGL